MFTASMSVKCRDPHTMTLLFMEPASWVAWLTPRRGCGGNPAAPSSCPGLPDDGVRGLPDDVGRSVVQLAPGPALVLPVSAPAGRKTGFLGFDLLDFAVLYDDDPVDRDLHVLGFHAHLSPPISSPHVSRYSSTIWQTRFETLRFSCCAARVSRSLTARLG